MKTIRKEQFKELDASTAEIFCRRMEAYLDELYPDEVRLLPRERLRGFIDDGMDMSRRYCIEDESDVARFLEVLLLVGLDFDENPDHIGLRQILQQRELASVRLDKVFEQLQFEDE